MRKLLDILPRRGPKAFDFFLDVLRQTKNDHIYDRLMNGASGVSQQGSYIRQPVDLSTGSGDYQLPEGKYLKVISSYFLYLHLKVAKAYSYMYTIV